MNTSYPTTAPVVNPATHLPTQVLSFHRWLCRWHAQTGDLHARTRYYARKQGVSERTIYRWIAALKAAGWITTETDPGIQRRIEPTVPPRRPGSGLSGARVRGPSCIASMQEDASTPASPPEPATEREVVAELIEATGLPEPVAKRVARGWSPEQIRRAVAAYRAARRVWNPAGWLTQALREGWNPSPMPRQAPQSPPQSREASRAVTVSAEAHRQRVEAFTATHGEGRAAWQALRGKMALAGRV